MPFASWSIAAGLMVAGNCSADVLMCGLIGAEEMDAGGMQNDYLMKIVGRTPACVHASCVQYGCCYKLAKLLVRFAMKAFRKIWEALP